MSDPIYPRNSPEKSPNTYLPFACWKLTQSVWKLSLYRYSYGPVQVQLYIYFCAWQKNIGRNYCWLMHSMKIAEIQRKARDSQLKMSHMSYIFLRTTHSLCINISKIILHCVNLDKFLRDAILYNKPLIRYYSSKHSWHWILREYRLTNLQKFYLKKRYIKDY